MNKIFTLIILTIFIFQVGCINNEENYDYFRIEINSDTDYEYNIIIPLPLYKNNTTLLSEKLKWNRGSGIYNITETEKGLGLNISAKGKIKLESRIWNKNDIEIYDRLTLSKYNDYYLNYHNEDPFYIYSFSNITINMNIKCNSGILFTYIHGTINNTGWTGVYGDQSRIVS